MEDKFRGLEKIYDHRSRYQHIQVYQDENKTGRLLVLDGKTQLTTWDQHRYHEALAAVPYMFTQFAKNVLILGGGDGYAAGVLLKYFPVDKITLVEIDQEVVDVARGFFEFPDDERLEVVEADAEEFVQAYPASDRQDERFDLVIADYTDPGDPHAAKLYTFEHFKEIRRIMDTIGVFVTQGAAPFINPKAAACLMQTVQAAFREYGNVQYYAVHLPMSPIPGQNGFCMAAPGPVLLHVLPGFRYLNPYSINSLFVRGNDELYDPQGIEISTRKNELYSQLFQMIYQPQIEEDIDA